MAYDRDDNRKLRQLQLVELDIMALFKRICEKHQLRYFMVGGTMLGAIRHKGFIPWDDDMDVGMPRPDYEKFIQLAPAELPEGYDFLNYKLRPSYNRYFSRLVDTRVSVYNASNSRTIVEHAWLDIFPLDGMPSGRLRQKVHFWRVTARRFLYRASCFSELANLNRPGRPLYLRIIIKFLAVTHLGEGLDTHRMMRAMEKQLLKYDYDASDYYVSMVGAYMQREIVDKKLLGALPEYPFETLMLRGAADYDGFLRHFYGDYMTPPSDADKDKHNIEKIEYSDEFSTHSPE